MALTDICAPNGDRGQGIEIPAGALYAPVDILEKVQAVGQRPCLEVAPGRSASPTLVIGMG